MTRKGKGRWMMTGVLIISMLAVFGYRAAQRPADRQETCKSSSKEQGDQKVKSGLPMWESLSRHLITIQR